MENDMALHNHENERIGMDDTRPLRPLSTDSAIEALDAALESATWLDDTRDTIPAPPPHSGQEVGHE